MNGNERKNENENSQIHIGVAIIIIPIIPAYTDSPWKGRRRNEEFVVI